MKTVTNIGKISEEKSGNVFNLPSCKQDALPGESSVLKDLINCCCKEKDGLNSLSENISKESNAPL